MKAIITLLVLGGIALGVVYKFGGYSNFDPEKQGQEARAKITPGMTLQKVILVAGSNPKYQQINKITHKIGGETVEELQEGTPVEFREERIKQAVKNKQVPNGFILTYQYTEKTAFAVHFDEDGKVIDVRDVMTMADLLQTR